MSNEKSILIFVYGTLKKGFHNHCFLRDGVLIGEGKTKVKYGLTSNGYYPSVHTNVPQEHSLNISGEIYVIDESTLNLLDSLETGYERISTVIILENKTEVIAYIYVKDHSNSKEYLKTSKWS